MTQDQIVIVVILLATMALFLWGRWRHDMVAAAALLACVLTGLVPATDAFAGFGHPAVITVACVLVLSRSLQTSGAVDALTHALIPAKAGMGLSMAALVGLGAVLSGFMNNVGALALLMPLAVRLAKRLEQPPGQILMPLAFGTILGGMTTLIGTPPNLIVSGFRAQAGLGSFAMFDFTPVGLAVAACGVAFVVLLGWRFVPKRKQTGIDSFETGAYITEVRVTEGSKAANMSLREIEAALDAAEAQVIGLIRNEVRLMAPQAGRKIRMGDILIIEADAEALSSVLSGLGLTLEGAKEKSKKEQDPAEKTDKAVQEANTQKDKDLEPSPDNDEDVILMELVVRPESTLIGRSVRDILLRTRFGINLLAISRNGQRAYARLRTLALQRGDLLLMQGPAEALTVFASDNGCVPLAERELHIPDKRKAWTSSLIMATAVVGAAFGLLPAAISFAMGVLASMALRTIPPRAVYETIDWSVVVLLGALIPVASAIESSGSAALIAQLLLDYLAQGHAIVGLVWILIVTMFLSDLMNNAATAAVMSPIALGTATALGVSPDAYLMAVAIGASCAFLTPIGHQNNTLILGPGGFRFGDYWKLGLPLELLVVLVSIPLLVIVWPL